MKLKEALEKDCVGLPFIDGDFYLEGSFSGKIYYKSWGNRKLTEELAECEITAISSDAYVKNTSMVNSMIKTCLCVHISDYQLCKI